MGLEQSSIRPRRCTLVNVTKHDRQEEGHSIECLFNPTQFSEAVQVEWKRLSVPGLSHQVLQYHSTGNRELTSVDFFLDQTYAERIDAPEIVGFRSFLRGLTVPPANTTDLLDTAPSRMLFIWPGVLTMEAVLKRVEFQYRQFGLDGRLLVYTASTSFEEILDVRVTAREREQEI